MHLKQMRACRNACHARSRIARFGSSLDPVIIIRQLIVEIERSVCLLVVH